MALSFNTGMTLISAADSATNWNVARIAGGGGAPSFGGLDTTVFKEGTGSVSSKVSVTNTDAVTICDWYLNTEGGKSTSTTVNLTTAGNEVICGWVQITSISAMRTYSNGGLYLLLSSSNDTGTTAPTAYSKWYIGGSDNYPGGWVFFMVDTRKTPSATGTSACNLAAVRRVGFGIYTGTGYGTIKSDNVFVDAMWYGRPRYQVVGDGSTVADWSSFLTNSNSTANGLLERIGGVYFFSSGIRFGNSTQTSTTTFTDTTGKSIILKRYTYHNGTSEVDALTYADYYVVDANGASTAKTAITLGTVVGAGDDRQGVQGGTISSADTTNLTWKMDFQTNKANLSAVKLYGVNINGAKEGCLFDNSATPTETTLVSLAFVNCGEIDPGTTGNGAEILNAAVIDPLGNANYRGLRFNSTHNIKKISCITSGTPTNQRLTHLPTTGTFSVSFDAIKFFGDFSSGTIYHGDKSGGAGTATINASNAANPNASEFIVTAGGTVTVSNSVNFTLTNLVTSPGTRVHVIATSGGPLGTGATIIAPTLVTASSTFTQSLNYSGDQPFKAIIANASGSPVYQPIIFEDTIVGTGFTRRIEQQLDQ